MIHAYQEIYRSRAQAVLGEALDYAVNSCCIPGDTFLKQFIVSSVSRKMENGEPAYLAGKSGIELAAEVVFETSGKTLTKIPKERFDRSAEYWIGWAVAYYQWVSGRKYAAILKAFSFDELLKMYVTLHEADLSKFADIAEQRMKERYPQTNLKRIRSTYGITQADLAQKSGVSLRSIQMYEQRKKNINKAGADTLYRLAKMLGCSMEDLMEPYA